jgi:hypothetical protein
MQQTTRAKKNCNLLTKCHRPPHPCPLQRKGQERKGKKASSIKEVHKAPTASLRQHGSVRRTPKEPKYMRHSLTEPEVAARNGDDEAVFSGTGRGGLHNRSL